MEIFDEQIEKRTNQIDSPAPKKSLFQILQRRYPPNEYALMKEVRDAAGYGASRSADYIAVNMWPSRGLAINGIEVKSYRSDWLNELKKPEKAQAIFQNCDYFWLLTTSESIAKLEEIPATWGWLSIKNEKIYVKKEAPQLQPIPLSKDFLCAMLRRACDKTDFVHIETIESRIEEARQSAKNSRDYEKERAIKERDEITKILNEFERASGLRLRDRQWQKDYIPKMGAAVKFILDGGSTELKEELLGLEKTAKTVLAKISEGLKFTESTAIQQPPQSPE